MNRKRRNWIIGAIVLAAILGVAYALARISLVCCAPRGDYFTATAIVALNQNTEVQIHQTRTAVFETAIAAVITATPSSYPYDPTLYAQRRHEEQLLQTAAGPTEYAIFYATETALVTTAESRSRDGNQYVDWVTQTALASGYHVTSSPTSTPIPYTADMSPTVTPRPTDTTRTATPTLCPPSDVICPGGNATMSAADKVMVLMASAKAPEFGQLAQTATALANGFRSWPTLNATEISATLASEPCAWSWATRNLPDTTQAVREILVNAGMDNIYLIRAEAYGEECGNSSSANKGFGAMTTDFYLSATVPDLSDKAALAQVVRTVYATLSAMNIKLPAKAGYLDIVFTSGGQEKRFRAMFSGIEALIEIKADDQKLLEAGGM